MSQTVQAAQAAPLSSAPLCPNCVFVQQVGGQYVCCRNPPTLSPGMPTVQGVFPAVSVNDWCAEWSPVWLPAPLFSYSAGISAAANSSAGDVFSISGSATMVVRVRWLMVTGLAGSGNNQPIMLIARSAANTGGTPTVVPGVPNDPQNPPATAVVTSYAAAPTMGPAIGIVRSRYLPIPNSSGLVGYPTPFLDPTVDQPITLRGVANCLCVTIPADNQATWSISVSWSENYS